MRQQGLNKDDAFVEAMRTFPDIAKEDTALSSCRNGKREVDYLEDVRKVLGHEVADESIERLRHEFEKQKANK